MLDRMMKRLAEEMQVEGSFATATPGLYLFPCSQEREVSIEPMEPRGFALFCKLGPLGGAAREEFYTHALFGNLYGQGTKKSTLGVSNTEELTLRREIDYTTNYEEFRDELEDFVNTVDLWSAEMRHFSAKN